MATHLVIMAGGSGTRFWPKSSRKNPKQFLDLCGKRSMIQLTYDRLKKLTPPKNAWVVTHKDFAKQVQKHLPPISQSNILQEPEARNTMAAVCLSAYKIQAKDPNAILVCLPADHFIGDVAEFQKTMGTAVKTAKELNRIVVIGMRPTYPATGFGYIEQGTPLNALALSVSRFHEKPDAQQATQYIQSGQFFWNAGIFVMPVRLFIEETREHAPEYSKIFDSWDLKENSLPRLYKKLPKQPIDIALMEKTRHGALLRGDFGWNDLGSWPSLLEVRQPNSDAGLIMSKGHFAVESKGVLIEAPDKFVGLVGVQDLIIVETDKALLICKMDRAQDIKKIVEHLQTKKRSDLF